MFKKNEESIIKKPNKLKSPENLLSIVVFSNKKYPISTPIINSQNLKGNKKNIVLMAAFETNSVVEKLTKIARSTIETFDLNFNLFIESKNKGKII